MTSFEARIISLKKQSNPIVSESMAAINVINTKCVRFSRNSTLINTEAIDIATHKPANINNPTDQRIHLVLLTIISSSYENLKNCSSFIAFMARARSIDRLKRLTKTPRIEPMPVNKNTGATASRIASETS